jgi:hypothetical protein
MLEKQRHGRSPTYSTLDTHRETISVVGSSSLDKPCSICSSISDWPYGTKSFSGGPTRLINPLWVSFTLSKVRIVLLSGSMRRVSPAPRSAPSLFLTKPLTSFTFNTTHTLQHYLVLFQYRSSAYSEAMQTNSPALRAQRSATYKCSAWALHVSQKTEPKLVSPTRHIVPTQES